MDTSVAREKAQDAGAAAVDKIVEGLSALTKAGLLEWQQNFLGIQEVRLHFAVVRIGAVSALRAWTIDADGKLETVVLDSSGGRDIQELSEVVNRKLTVRSRLRRILFGTVRRKSVARRDP